jgi:hypothetical protein
MLVFRRWGRSLHVKIILVIVAIFMLSSSSTTAQERLAGAPCVPDLRELCPGIQPGNDRLRVCMREHIRDVSYPCLVRLAKFAEVRRFRLIAVPTFVNSVRASSAEEDSSGFA